MSGYKNGHKSKNGYFLVCVGIMGLALSACSDAGKSGSEELPQADNSVALAVEKAIDGINDAADESSSSATPEEVEEGSLSGPQKNAVRSAMSYLSMTGFSRDGLIEQLSSDAGEGYSVADATAAVDSLNVDWNENAAKSAEQYLDMTGFSCKGLIEQLSSSAGSKYTVEQATYGAKAAGAC